MLHIIWDLFTIEFTVVFCVALVVGIWVAYYKPAKCNLKGKHVVVIPNCGYVYVSV